MGSVFALRVGQRRFLPLLDLERPAPSTRLFTTLADGQRKAIFPFYYREGPGRPWQLVGRIEWEALPPSPAGVPTLELRLIPGRGGNLLLRLRERSSGTAKSYQLRLPEVPLEAPPKAAREAPRKAPRAAPPVRERKAPLGAARPERPPAGKRIRRTVMGVALAVVLLAVAAVLLTRFTPLLETPAGSKPAVGSAPAAGQAPALPQPPAPEPTAAGVSGPETADGVSGASPRQPAAHESEPEAPHPRPEPEPLAQKPPAENPPEPLSYRVQWGDTLWQITEQYYGNPYLYSLLAGENAIVDPDLIIPGTELRLPPRIDDRDRK